METPDRSMLPLHWRRRPASTDHASYPPHRLMCGIAGFARRLERAEDAIVDRQLETLVHRGPDSRGWLARGRGTVGQTRLAIIDLLTGDPPITADDGRVSVALNGEIYNYAALREELLGRGHRFRTSGDTEVIAHLAEELGPVEVAKRLHGMFGAAIWDDRSGRLFLLRDRAGKKPLYYWSGPNTFVFGSEIKAVLAHPDVPRRMNAEALPAYLTFGYVPSPRTFYEGIRSVPPGHVLIVEPDLSIRCEAFWEPAASGMAGVSNLEVGLDEAARLVRAALVEAVTDRLVADVPVGAFLSGGIDSSAIVALMATATSQPVRTFTIGFEDDAGFDERPYARMVAERYGTEHVEFVVDPSAVDLVEELVWFHDQPFGDSSAVPTYLLSKLTSEHVSVALCGDGGDELFSGYDRFAAGVAASGVARLPAPATHGLRTLAALASRTGHPAAAKLERFMDVAQVGLPHALRSWISYVPDDVVTGLAGGTSSWALADYEQTWDRSAGAAVLDRLLLLNFQTYLLDDLLPKVDRMAMAHGLEVRAPFLDHRLVELAMRLPPKTKQRGLSHKRALKRAVGDLLPHEILDRPKRGFGVPLDRWFRDDLDRYVAAMLAASDARVRTHLRGDAVDRILAEHRSGARNHGHVLWTLLTLEVFLRRQGW